MIVFLNQDLLYLEFDSPNETRRVLETGKRSFRDDFLQLKWWDPSVGCVSKKDQVKEAWIEIVGLPLHLWTREILGRIRDSCGGFKAINKGTALRIDLLWARI